MNRIQKKPFASQCCNRHETASVFRDSARHGTAVVEVAFVAPVTFLLIIGIIVAGFGAFRYQQVAAVSREGARWASLRGPKYQKRTGNSRPTSQEVYQTAMKPMAATLREEFLNYNVTWSEDESTVAVTIAYEWIPEAYLLPLTLTSTSVMPVVD